MKPTTLLLSLFFLLHVATAAADCTCDAEDTAHDPKSVTTRYKVGAIVAILLSSTVGVALPVLGRTVPSLRPESDLFFVVKAIAAGVILATGFIHILPDAFESLTSPCLKTTPWQDFPFAGFAAMIGALGTLMIDSFATGYYQRANAKAGNRQQVGDADVEHPGHVHGHVHGAHGHVHDEAATSDLIRYRVTSQVLELGIVVHSVIIGITLGTSQSLNTIKPLMAALCFHQFFEGVGLGGCIVQARFNVKSIVIMALFFSLTTPVGIAIGIGITNVYDENSPTSLIVQGMFDSVAAGILVYMSLVDLLAVDFMNPKLQGNARVQFASYVSLLFGAGFMSLIAKWA